MSGVDCARRPALVARSAAAPRKVAQGFSPALIAALKGCATTDSLCMASLLLSRRLGLPAQRHFLHAPLGDFRDVDLVRVPAVHLMDAAELLRSMPGLAEAAEHRAVQLH